MRIVLDAGHGGHDPGAVGFGIEEEDITLALVLQIGQLLQQYKGVEIKYTRTDDRFLELSERADIANDWGADYFMSCHVNSGGNGTANGFESFIYTEPSQKSVAYQNTIHSEIVKSIKVNDRGKKRKNLAVLRETNCPAILTETLFINSASDNKKLKDSAFIRAAAAGHALGVASAFGLQLKERHPVSKPVPIVDIDVAGAVKTLQSAGIISSPDYWLQNAVPGGQVRGDYTASLLKNMARAVKR